MAQEHVTKLPLTVRRSVEVVGLYFLVSIIVVGKDIIAPILMAFFLAIMLMPVMRFLQRRKVPEVLSIVLALLLMILVAAGIIWFFSSQISGLIDDFPKIRENVKVHLNSLSNWISSKTNYTTAKQVQIINEQSEKMVANAGTMLSGTFASLTGIFVFVALLPIYIFLLLFYRNLLIRFVFIWFPRESHDKVEDVMRETQVIIKSYLVGLLIQISYITVLLGLILFFIGIKHAILIGVIFAILNLIPYIGALIGNIIGVLITLASSQELWPILAVLGAIAFVQFLDNNILMPRIVGSKVKINALATIIGVIVAGAIAGVSGMFLSLPIIAVLKIIFDRTDNLKQWGVVLGDERPKRSPLAFPMLRSGNRRVQEELERENKVEPPKEDEKKEAGGEENIEQKNKE